MRVYANWTAKQLKYLDENYGLVSTDQLKKELAPHTMGSIKSTASARKVTARGRKWRQIAAAHVMVTEYFERA
jgi:hypothetical protein